MHETLGKKSKTGGIMTTSGCSSSILVEVKPTQLVLGNAGFKMDDNIFVLLDINKIA